MLRSTILLIISLLISVINIFLTDYLFDKNGCVINRGIAFGISIEYIILLSILFIVLMIFLGCITKEFEKYILFSVSILGVSNLIVRVIYGGVCDYIRLFGMYVNLIDIFIVTLVIYSFLHITVFKKKV